MPPKRRRRYHGLYYHSSPPRVLQMNGSNGAHSGKEEKSKEVFVVKPSNIRIWIHDKDLAKLTKVLWVGQGNRLRAEVSNNARVKRFLDTVPHVMNVIRDMHQAAVANDIETLQLLLAPRSIPRSLIRSRDANGLTVMHKAAGFGYTMMVEYLLEVWPDGVTEIDGTGKTPLHWAASAKNNVRCYNLLVQAGADEEALDYKMRSAAYYKQKPSEIDRSLLSVIPDAPRIPHDSHPDWSALVHDDDIDFPRVDFIKNRFDSPRESEAIENGMKINARTLSIDNTSEPDMDDGISKLSVEEEALEAAIEEEKQEEPDFDDYTQEENDFPANGGDIFSRGETPLLEDIGEKTTDKDKEESEQNDQEKEVELIKESSGVDEMDELQPENENFLQNEPEVEAVNDDEESQNENITIEKSDLNIEETNDVDLNGKTEGFDDQEHAIFGNEASENEQMKPLEDTLNILKINIEEVKEDLTDLEIGDKENDELIDIENKENSEDENTIVQSDDNEELENVENLENDGEVSSTDGGNKGSEVDLDRDTKVAEIDNDDVIEENTVKDDVIVTIRINDQSLDPNNDAEDNDSKDVLMTNEHQEDAQIKDDDSEVNDDTDNNDEIVVNESISRKDQEEIAEDDDQKEQSQDNVKTAINNGAETVIGNADEIDDDDQVQFGKL